MTEFDDIPTHIPYVDEAELNEVEETSFEAPERIAQYRILRTLGEGGMGVVYEAQQDEPVRRLVALKIIKMGMDTQQVVARFESERQALAMMNHPNIARVFDAGATESGRPYFVMERVEGMPMTEYCDKHEMTPRQRLELFIDVCDGVQHAHQKGIIHRDLKPTNVLVHELGDKHIPKIIDFGIAKATDQTQGDVTVKTEMGQLVGTPEYLSPEQANMGAVDIDTRVDVYLLGVMLYELLTGLLPFDPKELRAAGFNELRRMIIEDDPPKPSSRLAASASALESISSTHGVEPRTLGRLLRGDLDWITMKALEKDRTRRYSSASELAADIGRYLKNEPVLASPPSNAYRLGKFVRRHKAGVVFSSMLALLLTGFAATMTVQRIQIAKARDQTRLERDRATEEARTAVEVSGFLESLFKISDPTETLGSTITAREILDRGSNRIDVELADQPRVQARLMHTMGQVYGSLGLVDDSRRLHEQALEVRLGHLGPEHLESASSMQALGSVLASRFGEFERARELYQRALDVRLAQLGEADAVVGSTMNDLAVVLHSMGDYDGAAAYYAQAFGIWEEVLGPEHPQTLVSLNNRAALLARKGDYAAAQPLYQRSLEIRRRVLGTLHPKVALTLVKLAGLLEAQHDYAGAMAHHREALEIREQVFGAEHRLIADSNLHLARLSYRLGLVAQATEFHERAVAIHRATGGFDNPFVLFAESTYAALSGREEQALTYLRRAVDHGFSDVDKLLGQQDFESVREDPRYRSIVEELRQQSSRP